MGKKAIIFDWDGTLFDSMEYKRENAVRIFTDLGFDADKVRALHRRYSGLPRQQLFELIYAESSAAKLTSEHFQILSDTYTRMNLDSSRTAKLFPEVNEALSSLNLRYRLFVSSSSDPDELESVVAAKVLGSRFDAVFGSRGPFRKGKEHVQHIAKTHGLELQDILFVGDDEQDLVLAKEAGIDAIRIQRHKAASNPAEISSLAQLEGRVP